MTLWPRMKALLAKETLSARDIADRLQVSCYDVSPTLQKYKQRGHVTRVRLSSGEIYWRLSNEALRALHAQRDPLRNPAVGDVFASRFNGERRRVLDVIRSKHGGLQAVCFENVPSTGHRRQVTGDSWKQWLRSHGGVGAQVETERTS